MQALHDFSGHSSPEPLCIIVYFTTSGKKKEASFFIKFCYNAVKQMYFTSKKHRKDFLVHYQ